MEQISPCACGRCADAPYESGHYPGTCLVGGQWTSRDVLGQPSRLHVARIVELEGQLAAEQKAHAETKAWAQSQRSSLDNACRINQRWRAAAEALAAIVAAGGEE